MLEIVLEIDQKAADDAADEAGPVSEAGGGAGEEDGRPACSGPKEDEGEGEGGRGVVAGLAALLRQAPSNASINAATALGNICRRGAGRRRVISSKHFETIADELCEMVINPKP